MARKGTCENCRREKISLVSKGLCWKCYDAQRGLEGGKREIALANARTKPAKKYKKRSTAKDTAGTGQNATNIESSEAGPPVLEREEFLKLCPATEESSEAENHLYDDQTILLEFFGEDAELYKLIIESAKINRREPVQEILHILEFQYNGARHNRVHPGDVVL